MQVGVEADTSSVERERERLFQVFVYSPSKLSFKEALDELLVCCCCCCACDCDSAEIVEVDKRVQV